MSNATAIKVAVLSRAFQYAGVDLVDPDPSASPDEIKTFYQAIYPELNNAAVEGPVSRNKKLVFTFVRNPVRTKG